MLPVPVPPALATAARSYQGAFGHPVPDEVLEMFAARPGPLILEIRQAVTLQRPVKGWLAKANGSPLRAASPA